MRKDVCAFSNDKSNDAQRLAALHELLQRPTAESRLLLDRIERYTTGLNDAKRQQQPGVTQALTRIATDTRSRERFLAFARDSDEPQTRARMINVAHSLGWLSRDERRDEFVKMFDDMLAHDTIAPTEVDLACNVNKTRDLDGVLQKLTAAGTRRQGIGHAAVLACLGSGEAHARTLNALASPSDSDVRVAQAYLRQRPIEDAKELRAVTKAIAGMSAVEAQARALDTLARHYLSDRESIDMLKQLFAKTRSWQVQNAIAGVLLRADANAIDESELLRTVREFRLKASPSDNMVDALIQRLKLS
jgi:hypothetical protein